MKIVKKIIKFVILVILVAVIIFVQRGHELYMEAILETPIAEKVASIKAKKNYTYLDEIPEIYKKAVIAVEDNRFYAHTRH